MHDSREMRGTWQVCVFSFTTWYTLLPIIDNVTRRAFLAGSYVT